MGGELQEKIEKVRKGLAGGRCRKEEVHPPVSDLRQSHGISPTSETHDSFSDRYPHAGSGKRRRTEELINR